MPAFEAEVAIRHGYVAVLQADLATREGMSYVDPAFADDALVREWVRSRIERLDEHGPEPDGWAEMTPGVWQLCGRLVEMPPVLATAPI